MAISFESTLKAQESAANASLVEEPVMVMALVDDTESWTRSDKYLWYDEYYDNEISTIDNVKNITVNQNQINITQESNSQFIPFRMPRYYDGVDLMNMNILIHFVTSAKFEDYASPINVSYSESKIQFGWLVSKNATSSKGDLLFEIHAVGTNSKGDEYLWKTKPNGKLNIIESLQGNGIVEPDSSWITSFLTQVNEKVGQAQTAAQEAQNAVVEAQSAVDQANEAVTQVRNTVDTAKSELEASLNEAISGVLSNYYTKTEVDNLIANIDLSSIYEAIENIDGLANFRTSYDSNSRVLTFYNGDIVICSETLNSNPTSEWIAAYDAKIEGKISDATSAVQSDLDSYKSTTNADLEAIHSEIDGLPETLRTDYYTKTDTDSLLEEKAEKSTVTNLSSTVSVMESTVNTNKSNISVLGTKISDLETTVGNIDTSPRLTYEATYDEEQIYTLWEIEGEGDQEVRTPKGQFKIQGGGGGSSTSSILKIEYVTKTPLVATVNDKILITYIFSGTDSSGDAVMEGVATWKIGNTVIATNTAISEENTFDITDYINIGTQKVTLSITDDAGSLVTKSWTVQKIDVHLESSFNDKLTYPIDTLSFDYTPYGAISKVVHFILDGVELPSATTSSSGIPMAYSIPAQAHGSHLLEVYLTAEINGNTIESNHIYKDILFYDSSKDIPVIGCIQQNITAKQYDTTNIVYTVYDPRTETPKVTLAVDDVVVSTQTMSTNTQTWQYKSSDIGEHVLTITCRDTVKTLHVTIEKLDIDVEPITANLVFDFNPTGRSNNDEDKLWTDGKTSMSVSDNFDWTNGGYQLDSNGDQYFCIKAGTSATIDYKLFADDAKRNGKEFKLVFKTTNVKNPNATFLSCVDNTTESNHIGIRMDVHEAYIYAQAGNLFLPYSEEDIIEFEFNISKNTEDIPMVMGYEDGVSTSPLVYDDSYSFTQNTPKIISLGSDDCDLHIYRFKVYNSSLTSTGILNNFIADARNAEEMISRYKRNQIYNENNELTPEILAEKCPQLRIIKIEAPYFTNNKSDKVPNTTIECIYKGGDPILDNWIAYNCQHSGQGTSSNNYGAAGRNLDLIMNKSGLDGIKPRIVLGDGSETTKVSLTRNSIPNNYYNVKVNIASSENANNALLQRRYNTYNPYTRPFIREDETEIPKIKDTMEFYNCVVFIKESDPNLSTHREFADNQWHYYSFGNIGDSKKTDKTRLTDPNDKYECCVEIMDVELPNSSFPRGDEALDNLEKDPFDESMTYGLRYIWEDGTDEENAEVLEFVKNKWIEFYKFVINSTDEEFYSKLGDYFVINSALYYYLFTTRYTMVDNRCKNSFWHYGKTGEVDTDGNPIRKWDLSWDYDNDTALGINNYGDMVYRYGFEDTDVDEKGEEIFRCSNSTFFCRIRDLFSNELKSIYNTLESQNAWHGESLISQFDEWQSQFPEELWRIDIERKYIRTYNSSFIDGAGDSQFLNNMAHGKKKYQRRQFERNQEKYMASKYQSSVASSDNAVLRCTVPSGNLAVAPNYKLKLTPYAYMYLNVKYGTNAPIQVKAEPNIEYEIPFTGNSADIIDIYSSSLLTSLGDLSPCYAATIDTSKAKKLKKLLIGNETEGYDNPYLTTLTLGANYLLEELNIENVSGLTQSLNLSELSNLSKLYARGSNVGGVTFADGGKVEIAELPAVNAITMKNLMYLNNLDVESYDKLATFRVENCNTVDVLSIINSSPKLNRVRIVGINWNLENTSLLERLYGLYGIDNVGYNVDKAVLTGSVYVPIIRQKLLADYNAAWSDLSISYDTLITQFSVVFQNDDGTTLDIQYIDKGEKPVDPITRGVNPIDTPTKASTVSTDFTYNGWDSELIPVFSNQIITATYSETTRVYTAKFVSKGVTLQETSAPYGSAVFYEGDIPTYTAEESAYVYYLFTGWDKGGFINGDKIINAVYDRFEYTEGCFTGMDISEMSEVQIYALMKMNKENEIVEIKDSITIKMGDDYTYDDVQEEVLINEKTLFSGSNYIDTKINLLAEDKDWTLVIDYKWNNGNENNAVLIQCYQGDGSNGFKLWNSSNPRITWGTASTSCASINKRDVLVLRHIKGETLIHIYKGNLPSESINYTTLSATRTIAPNQTLVFGCSRADDGAYENYANGVIYWCKLWYADLGDNACRKLATWTHETISLEMGGFKRYYLSDGSGKRCSMTFMGSHSLDNTMPLNGSTSNTGGWKEYTLNSFLNNRFYSAFPVTWKQLIKQVKIPSTIGNKSSDVTTSNCYIAIPSVIEVDATKTYEPYSFEGETFAFITSDSTRARKDTEGNKVEYWLRSPNYEYENYVFSVSNSGSVEGYNYGLYEKSVVIILSI